MTGPISTGNERRKRQTEPCSALSVPGQNYYTRADGFDHADERHPQGANERRRASYRGVLDTLPRARKVDDLVLALRRPAASVKAAQRWTEEELAHAMYRSWWAVDRWEEISENERASWRAATRVALSRPLPQPFDREAGIERARVHANKVFRYLIEYANAAKDDTVTVGDADTAAIIAAFEGER